MSEHNCQGSSCRCNSSYTVGAVESPKKKQSNKGRSAGPVTVKKADGSVEVREPYSSRRLKQIIGHDRAEEREYGLRKPRQSTVAPD
jgi:hypothetical protein